MGGEINLVQAMGNGEAELNQAYCGIVITHRDRHITVAVDNLRAKLALQLHDDLRADSAPGLYGIFCLAEPGAQTLAD